MASIGQTVSLRPLRRPRLDPSNDAAIMRTSRLLRHPQRPRGTKRVTHLRHLQRTITGLSRWRVWTGARTKVPGRLPSAKNRTRSRMKRVNLQSIWGAISQRYIRMRPSTMKLMAVAVKRKRQGHKFPSKRTRWMMEYLRYN